MAIRITFIINYDTYFSRQFGYKIKTFMTRDVILFQFTLLIKYALYQASIWHPGWFKYLNCGNRKKLAFIIYLLIFNLDGLFKVIVNIYKISGHTQVFYPCFLHFGQVCKNSQHSTISHSYFCVIQTLNDLAFSAVCVKL